MSRLQSLRAISSLSELALLLGFKPQGLAYILYIKSDAAKYTAFTISKKSGGERPIRAPSEDLKNLQARLAGLLQDCDEQIRADLNLRRTIAHGFVRKKSIMTNASEHLHKRSVFNIDIEDFFGTINFGRVRGFFIKNRNFSLNPKVATILAQIVCHENSLPQGAPTSPVISNLIAHILDVRLAKIASKVGCTYSRYADDLTFSTNKREFPSDIASTEYADPHAWRVGDQLRRVIHATGFSLNDKKTRMHYRDSRQQVTGLVVNRKVNIRIEYRRHVRQMVNRLCNTGTFQLVPATKVVEGKDEQSGTLEQLAGMLSFMNSVRRYEIKRHEFQLEWLPSDKSFLEIYRKFLTYKDFYGVDRPVILLEGKTDNIYLRCAMRQLVDDLPNLAKKDASGKIELSVRLFRQTNTTGEVLGLSGGSGDLKNFIAKYKSTTSKFKAEKSAFPIIIVIDNDEGAKGIYSVIKKELKRDISGDDPYYKIFDHLYVVPTPRMGAKESCIENLFDPSVLQTNLAGKTFNGTKDSDGSKHYGKYDLARYVIKANEKEISFSGFLPMMSTINSIVASHGVG